MSGAKKYNMIRRIVDAAMTVLLLILMAYQVTGEVAHEWIGMGMTALVIIHQILNRKWYGAIFKGKYNPYRCITTILNILLLASFALTAFCGMSMSGYAVPFAFLDYEKAGWLVFLENLLMLLFWAYIGTQAALICRNIGGKEKTKKNPLLPVAAIMVSVIIGIVLTFIFPASDQ